MYRNTRVLFIFGKYNFFNKLVSDTFKYKNLNTEENSLIKFDDDISREFGFTDDEEDEDSTDTQTTVGESIDLATFLSVVNVPNLNGKWYYEEK